jgi:hypothetical protein
METPPLGLGAQESRKAPNKMIIRRLTLKKCLKVSLVIFMMEHPKYSPQSSKKL